jgi:hypothetical protein
LEKIKNKEVRKVNVNDMEKEYKHIEELLERFFEGETSNGEERILYQYFTQEDVPEHLRRYKRVFAYFETGIAGEIEQPAPVVALPQRKSRRVIWAGIAASFLILLASSLFFIQKNASFDPYEGSYIIRNGERITDINRIRPELEATVQYVLQQQEKSDKLIACLSEMENKYARIEQQDIAPDEKILEQITSKFVREEVRRIFGMEYKSK